MRVSAFSGSKWGQLFFVPLAGLLFSVAVFTFWRINQWEWEERKMSAGDYTIARVEDPKTRSDTLERHIRKTCETLRFPEDGARKAMAHMHYDDDRKVIYCFIPKVASTSWKRVWLRMTNRIKPNQNATTMSRYAVHVNLPVLAADRNAEEKLRTYRKFMVVRHPFERVLSAYRDKLEGEYENPGYSFHKQVGKRIQMKYRGATYREGHNVTFAEFIRFISEAGRGTEEQRNEHWLPMHELCQPCAVRYDFISKYENLKEDADYLLQWLGLTDLVDGFPAADNRTFHASRLDPKYLGQLSHSNIMAFHAKHLADFLLFNYTFT
ncbi:carbohydrate sulfotransferase 11-like isoform X3 [Eriocheir sinensis]|uniref:carbohydrate sulfotransferase 11-like isoform X2 n=1 Tax=Eriocheir sinensis TaxID=95602 RepID=UPI0021C67295|nr:carbohydrate sulfotransferase 11-like isoform X2 [Eriocheir sinensis]XP_050707412.1 carbohydrate sulfotransferase 11-like isoform X3 [Eriocheir sinensis]